MLLAALLALTAACAGAVPPPPPPPLLLEAPLPALEQFGANGPEESVTTYHLPVGVPEAARIAALEARKSGSHEAGPHGSDEASSSESQGSGEAESGLPAPPEDKPETMIVGGLASYNGEHPFMAGLVISLTSGETSVCGGSLVSSTRVLTAAACYWDGASQAYAMLVVLGSVTLFSGGVRVSASSINVHALYSPASIHYNLALLTVPYQASSTYVRPIALASSGDHVGVRAEAIGYGRTSDSAPITTAASLRDVFVDVISTAACQQYYGSQVSAAEMCSSGAGGRNPCGGDQGGPLIVYSSAGNDLLLGVFTFGSSSGCAAGAPAGYQRLAYHYSWVWSLI